TRRAGPVLLPHIGRSGKRLWRRGCGVVGGRGQFFRAGRRCLGFAASFREQPAWQAAGGAARNVRARGRPALLNITAGKNGLPEVRLRFVSLRLDGGGSGRARSRLVSVLRERF